MGIVRTRKEPGKFFLMHKDTIEDPNLSWKAKGLLAYLMSKPNDWEIWVNDLVKRSTDGRSAVLSGLKELLAHKYANRIQQRREDGTLGPVEYTVYEEPQSGFPLTDKPLTDKPLTDNRTHTNNDSTKNDCTENNATVSKTQKHNPTTSPPDETWASLSRKTQAVQDRLKHPVTFLTGVTESILGTTAPTYEVRLKQKWNDPLASLLAAADGDVDRVETALRQAAAKAKKDRWGATTPHSLHDTAMQFLSGGAAESIVDDNGPQLDMRHEYKSGKFRTLSDPEYKDWKKHREARRAAIKKEGTR